MEQTIGGEDVEVWASDDVVAEGVDGSSGSDATTGQIEAGTEGVTEGLSGGLEEEVEEVPAFAEDAAQHLWK